MPKPGLFRRALRLVSRLAMWSTMGAAVLPLDGCAVAALPCRLTSASLKMVPVVGHAAATPFDACAATID